MKKLLITGFYGTQTEPRPPSMNNSSGKIAERLNGRTIAGYEVEGEVIDAPILERARLVQNLIETRRPFAYLALGVAPRSNKFTFFESVVNEIDTTSQPHHSDGQLENIPIVPGAPNLLINNTIDFDVLTQRFDSADLSNKKAQEVRGAGAVTVAFAQLYYATPNIPQLAMMVPADHEFSQWIENVDGEKTATTMDLAISEFAATLALEALVESRATS